MDSNLLLLASWLEIYGSYFENSNLDTISKQITKEWFFDNASFIMVRADKISSIVSENYNPEFFLDGFNPLNFDGMKRKNRAFPIIKVEIEFEKKLQVAAAHIYFEINKNGVSIKERFRHDSTQSKFKTIDITKNLSLPVSIADVQEIYCTFVEASIHLTKYYHQFLGSKEIEQYF
jgi:hypothetical protein